jgi:hypothetical protein
VHDGAVQDQGNTDGNIQQREPIQQEYPGSFGDGSHPIKDKQKQHQPQDGVDRLDGKLSGGEEQREKRDMTGYRQGSEGAKIPSILQGNETERDDDKKDRLLVDVPTEEKRGISAQSDRPNKRIPLWSEPQLDQTNLGPVSSGCGFYLQTDRKDRSPVGRRKSMRKSAP